MTRVRHAIVTPSGDVVQLRRQHLFQRSTINAVQCDPDVRHVAMLRKIANQFVDVIAR